MTPYRAMCGAVLLTVALSRLASAGPIVLSGSSWTDAPADAFWAQRSYDRNGFAHVGVFLAGTPGSDVPGFYANSPFLDTLVWLGTGATTFTWDGPTAYAALVGVTGWVDTFAIEQGVFVFRSPTRTWRSDALDGGRSHFAVFDSPTHYYVGMEDATWDTPRTADWDYNDRIIAIAKPVPDSGSTLLLLGVLLPVWLAYGAYRAWTAYRGARS